DGDASLSVTETSEHVRVESGDVRYVFDPTDGALLAASVDGVDVLESGPEFDVWRPPTINESAAFTPWCPEQISGWLELGLDDLSAIATDVTIDAADAERFELAVDSFVSGPGTDAGFEVSTRYRVHPDGVVACAVEADPNGAFHEALEGWLPRMGVQFDVPRTLSTFEWYGRGPHESYPDRKESAHVDRHAGSVAEQIFPYCPPQAAGNKCDTRWASLADDDGRGVVVFGETPASVCLQPHENVHEAMYTHELRERETIGLDLDWRTAGVGGTPVPPLPEHRVPPEATAYSFGFRPLASGDDPMAVWRAASDRL
ncbi:MAG: beta-galactosidase small subunit, partial [Halanaeroarchaeum sp.]